MLKSVSFSILWNLDFSGEYQAKDFVHIKAKTMSIAIKLQIVVYLRVLMTT